MSATKSVNFFTILKYIMLVIFSFLILPYGIGFIILIVFLGYRKYRNSLNSSMLLVYAKEENTKNSTEKIIYNKKARDIFFSKNYLKESAADSYGSARELIGIVPLTIVYENNYKEINTRYIEVFAISTANKRAFLLAFCHLKSASRVFSPFGIKSMKDLNGKEYNTREEINSFFLEKVVPLVKNERNKKIVENCFVR